MIVNYIYVSYTYLVLILSLQCLGNFILISKLGMTLSSVHIAILSLDAITSKANIIHIIAELFRTIIVESLSHVPFAW